MVILNIGSGKTLPLILQEELIVPYFLVNIDKGYKLSYDSSYVHHSLEMWLDNEDKKNETYYVSESWESFLSSFAFKADLITCYRFLEHIPKKEILNFLYHVADSIKIGGKFEGIVPDYEALAKRILDEDVSSPDFDKQDIITTYELSNVPENPHASIWTNERLNHFLPYENRFSLPKIEKNYLFDGRNLYIKFLSKRI